MAGPLQGIKVLDLSRILAGPWATQTLADFGAEVIKIERPGAGDDTRRWGPPFCNQDEENDAAYFLSANRGKKSIALDISTTEGQKIVHQLAAECDVFVENFKVDGLKSYGLDFDSIKSTNPAIIYCSITGFGQTGPYANNAGYDAIIQGMAGLMSVTGEKDDLPGGGPQKVGVAISDLLTGMYAVSAITAALFHRVKSGEGQHIDLALLDTQVACLANQSLNYLVGREVPARQGTGHPNIVPYQAVKAKDGHFMLAVGNDGQFKRFCEVANLQEIASDSRFRNNQSRVKNRDYLIELIESQLKSKNKQEWIRLLEERHVPCAPINDVHDVFADPQVINRGLQFNMLRQNEELVPQVANPVRFSNTPVEYQCAPPELGKDGEEILRQIGYDEDAIQRLVNDKVIIKKVK